MSRIIKMTSLIALVAAAAFTVGLTACGGDGGEGADAPTVEVTITDPAAGAERETPTEPSPTEAAPRTFNDAFSYCAAVGTIDEVVRLDTSADDVTQWKWVTVDSRWSGPPVPEAVKEFFGAGPGGPLPEYMAERGLYWRCVEGEVWGCSVGANLPCGKAYTSTEPRQGIVEFCQENPDMGVPFGASGHDNIYEWECQGTVPVIVDQVAHTDPRGFISEFWFRIQP